MTNPHCEECQGASCKITPGPVKIKNLVGVVTTFYDEGGKYHQHDPNEWGQSFSCSNGHQWEESAVRPCHCGWNGA